MGAAVSGEGNVKVAGSIAHSGWREAWFALVLMVVTVGAYWPAMGAGFIWDDDDYVVNNGVLAEGFGEAMRDTWLRPEMTPQYYPLVFTTFWVERRVWGMNPAGYHVANVLLHAGSAVLLWRILRRLRIPGAAVAAAVFAVHPVMVESVAWVTERKNTLCMAFFLGAVLCFLRFSFDADGKRRWGWYAGAAGCFVLAMLSKSVAATLAPVLLLLVWWKGPAAWRYVATLPFWTIGAIGGWNTARLEVAHVHAVGKWWDLSAAERVLVAGRAVCFYVWKLLAPAQLSFYYRRWEVNAGVWWQWVFPAVVVAGLVGLFVMRRRWGKGALVAGLAFVALLFPALGFFAIYPQIFSWVADHFAYLGAAAFIPAVVAAGTVAARRWLPGREVMIAAGVVAVLAVKTNLTARDYVSLETLWDSVLAYDPAHPHWNALAGKSMVLHERSMELLAKGDLAGAKAKNEESRRLDERALVERPDFAAAYNNLAGYWLMVGDAGRAEAMAQRAVNLEPGNAMFVTTLARAWERGREFGKAAGAYRWAVQKKPGNAGYWLGLARAIQQGGGEAAEGRDAVKRALALDPGNGEGHLLMGRELAEQGKLAEAVPEFREAARLMPGDAGALGDYARAVAELPGAGAEDLKAGVEAARRAVEMTGGRDAAYVERWAVLLDKYGGRKEAVKVLEEGAGRMPGAEGEGLRKRLAAYEGDGAGTRGR